MSAELDYRAKVNESLEPLREYTRQMLQLGYGSSLLDVGCGPASDTIAFGRLVGKAGKVTGIDPDTESIERANARAREMGVDGWVQHEVGDAQQLPYPDNSFDAVHCARMLHHVPDPLRVISEMVRVAKPGAWIVMSDMDMTSRTWDVSDPALRAAEWSLRKAREHVFDDPYTGKEIYRWARQVGLQAITAQPFAFAVTDIEVARKMGQPQKVEEAAIASGMVSASDVAALNHLMDENANRNEFFGYYVSVVVAGRK